MNEKIKLHMSLEGVLVYKVKQVLEKWLKEHDQRILEEFVEYMTCGNEDHIGMEYTVKEFKDNLEQFRKEREW